MAKAIVQFSAFGELLAKTVHWMALTALVVGILSGKADFGRLGGYLGPLAQVEVRALALPLCLLALIVREMLERDPCILPRLLGMFAVAGPLAIFLGFSFYAAGNLWDSQYSPVFFNDLAYFIAFVAVAALAFRTRSDLIILAALLDVIAFVTLLGVLLLWGPKTHEYNYGELATTITIYRVMGCGVCAAFYLMFAAKSRAMRLLNFALAAIFVFGCLASTSRSGILGVAAILGTVFLAAAIAGRWRELLTVVLATAVGLVAFNLDPRSDALKGRLDAVQETLAPTQNESTRSTVSTGTCDPRIVSGQPGDAFIREDSCLGAALIPDPAHRLRMSLHAMRVFNTSPIWGAGPLGYKLLLADPGYEPVIYTYPHNVFLEVAAIGGSIGLGLVSLPLVVGLVIVVRAVRSDFSLVFLCGIPVLYMVGSLTGGDLYDARMAWIVVAILVAIYGALVLGRKQRMVVDGSLDQVKT